MTVATFRGSSGAELYFTLPLPREFAAQVDRGELVPLDGPEPEPASPAEHDGQRPAHRAPKRDWVDYAAAARVLDREQAEALTKEELVRLLTPGMPSIADAFAKAPEARDD